VVIPDELAQLLAENEQLQAKFTSLSKGKQRDYAEYVATAKRVPTKVSRLEKIAPMIMQGIGLNDRYK
ncbi:MAG: YdeI/OmpD-associated family protein, partial [Verrucomicrobiota bacterium]